MAQLVKGNWDQAKSDDPNLISSAHVVEGQELSPASCPFTVTHVPWHVSHSPPGPKGPQILQAIANVLGYPSKLEIGSYFWRHQPYGESKLVLTFIPTGELLWIWKMPCKPMRAGKWWPILLRCESNQQAMSTGPIVAINIMGINNHFLVGFKAWSPSWNPQLAKNLRLDRS